MTVDELLDVDMVAVHKNAEYILTPIDPKRAMRFYETHGLLKRSEEADADGEYFMVETPDMEKYNDV